MVRVEKFHGTGNDFVLVRATAGVPDRSAFARAVCDRERGLSDSGSDRIGADGVLFLSLDAGADPPRVGMELVQPDGSIAAMCGNGARCVAAWAAEQLDATRVTVEADAGSYPATVEEDGADTWMVSLDLAPPAFGPSAVPLADEEPLIERPVEGLRVTAVDTGVPHAVAFVDDVDAVDLGTVGPQVRHAEVFPEGANVTVAEPSGDGYRVRTYERGVEDETASCGTAAVAVVAAGVELGRTPAGQPTRVEPAGGALTVTVTDGGATLRGPVVRSFRAEVPASLGA